MPGERRSGLRSPTPATGRSRSARTITSAETNAALAFDRAAARGFRLNIAAGTAVRFEPGQQRTVELVALAGARVVYGFTGAVMGPLEEATKAPAVKDSRREKAHRQTEPPMKIGRRAYAEMFGPTIGRPGSPRRHRSRRRSRKGFHGLRRRGEVRRRQGDPRRHGPESARRPRRARTRSSPTRSSIDWSGIVKATSAIKDGRIAKLGKAGNPDIQPGVDIVIGAAPRSSRVKG